MTNHMKFFKIDNRFYLFNGIKTFLGYLIPNPSFWENSSVTYTDACGNKINNNDKRTHFFTKIYLSHFIRNSCERVEKGLRVRGELETEQTATYSPPTSSFVFSSTSFSFCWAAQSGVLRAHSTLLGAGSLYSILSPTNWLQLWLNFLSHRVISLFDTHLLPVSIISAPNSTRPQPRLYSDIFDRMNLFLNRRLGRRSICYSSGTI